ncbi:MFS transporter [Kitasatospora sp. NPDC004615]|uniref:MFS transporter n=1 Tax=Kitasatospora sp. NPDC004615 TaxID=3364017 RepID=UPI00367E84AC
MPHKIVSAGESDERLSAHRRRFAPEPFRAVLGASVLANTADGVFQMGLLLVAARLTHSGGASSLVMVVMTLPWLIFGVPAGVLADKTSRKVSMVAADGARALLIAVVGVAAACHVLSLPVLLVLAFLVGVAETVFNTSSETVLPTIVAPDALTKANGRLNTSMRVTSQFIAPPLAGWLTAIAMPLTFLGAAAGYLGSMLQLALLPKDVGRVPAREEEPTRIWTGLAFVLRHRTIRMITFTGALTTLANTSFLALLVVYATSGPLHLSDAGYGLLLSCVGVGTALGSLTAHRAEQRLGSAPVLCASRIGWGLMFVAPVLFHGPWLWATMTAGSCLGGMWGVVTVSLRQRLTPPEIRGAVGGAYRTIIMGAMPAGAALGALVQSRLGTPTTFLLYGVGMAVLAVPVYRSMPKKPRKSPALDPHPSDALTGPGRPGADVQ